MLGQVLIISIAVITAIWIAYEIKIAPYMDDNERLIEKNKKDKDEKIY